MPVEQQAVIIWTVTNGHLDDIPVEKIKGFEEKFLDFMKTRKEKILETIAKEKTIDDKTIRELAKATEEFKKGFKVK